MITPELETKLRERLLAAEGDNPEVWSRSLTGSVTRQVPLLEPARLPPWEVCTASDDSAAGDTLEVCDVLGQLAGKPCLSCGGAADDLASSALDLRVAVVAGDVPTSDGADLVPGSGGEDDNEDHSLRPVRPHGLEADVTPAAEAAAIASSCQGDEGATAVAGAATALGEPPEGRAPTRGAAAVEVAAPPGSTGAQPGSKGCEGGHADTESEPAAAEEPAPEARAAVAEAAAEGGGSASPCDAQDSATSCEADEAGAEGATSDAASGPAMANGNCDGRAEARRSQRRSGAFSKQIAKERLQKAKREGRLWEEQLKQVKDRRSESERASEATIVAVA